MTAQVMPDLTNFVLPNFVLCYFLRNIPKIRILRLRVKPILFYGQSDLFYGQSLSLLIETFYFKDVMPHIRHIHGRKSNWFETPIDIAPSLLVLLVFDWIRLSACVGSGVPGRKLWRKRRA